jgi:hypothetical protein
MGTPMKPLGLGRSHWASAEGAQGSTADHGGQRGEVQKTPKSKFSGPILILNHTKSASLLLGTLLEGRFLFFAEEI